jgi:hypothetical protein
LVAAFRVLWRGLGQFERYGYLFILANILAAALCLPIVTAPAAYAGLVRLSYTAQTGLTATMGDFWDGFRAALGRSVIMVLANLILFGILIANFATYRLRTDPLFITLRGVWLLIGIGWLLVQLYLWPMLEAMEPATLLGGLRNAGLMALKFPGFSLLLLALLLILAAISTALVVPWILITMSLFANVSTAAVRDRLQH